MKSALRILAGAGVLALLLASPFGCSRNPGAKVNIQAQIAALKSGDPNQVQDACVELAKTGERAAPAVPDLIALLKDKNEEVRRLAAYALGEIGPKAKAASAALQEMLASESSMRVIGQIGNTLRSLDPSNAPPVVPNIQ